MKFISIKNFPSISFEFLRVKLDFEIMLALSLYSSLPSSQIIKGCTFIICLSPPCKCTYFLTDMRKTITKIRMLLGCKRSSKLALLALALSSLGVYCPSGATGNPPFSAIQASIKEAAVSSGRRLGCGVRRFGLKPSTIHQELQTLGAILLPVLDLVLLFVKRGK